MAEGSDGGPDEEAESSRLRLDIAPHPNALCRHAGRGKEKKRKTGQGGERRGSLSVPFSFSGSLIHSSYTSDTLVYHMYPVRSL